MHWKGVNSKVYMHGLPGSKDTPCHHCSDRPRGRLVLGHFLDTFAGPLTEAFLWVLQFHHSPCSIVKSPQDGYTLLINQASLCV